MKILVLSSRVPAAGKSGDQIVSLFRVMYLARANKLQIICFGSDTSPEEYEARRVLEGAGIVVHFVKRSRLTTFMQLLLAIVNPQMPFQCALSQSKDFQRTVSRVTQLFEPDAFYCVMIRIFSNINNFESKIFVDLVDSMGLNFSRRGSMAGGPFKWLLNIEASRAANFERLIAEKTTRSFVVSRIDQAYINVDKVNVIPLGIDMRYFYSNNYEPFLPVIAFTGNMFYQPNVDAILWFFKTCWLDIKSKVPGVRLVIAGSNPLPSVLSLGQQDKDISVIGRVESMASILNTAAVAIAPMQSGSGMQFKILEAMACGVPVVTTTLGLGDIGASSGEGLLVADAPADFCNLVINLLKSEVLANDIGIKGVRYIASNHSWEVLNAHFALSCGIDMVNGEWL